MSKFIEKLGKSKIFMSIVMVYNIIFNIIMLVGWINSIISISKNSQIFDGFGNEMNYASLIALIILHIIIIGAVIIIFVKLLKKYKEMKQINFKSLIFNDEKNKWLNIFLISTIFLFNIIYSLITSYLAIAPVIISAIHNVDVRIDTTIIGILLALIVFIFAILNILYYAFLIKKLLQKPKEELKEDVNKEVNE